MLFAQGVTGDRQAALEGVLFALGVTRSLWTHPSAVLFAQGVTRDQPGLGWLRPGGHGTWYGTHGPLTAGTSNGTLTATPQPADLIRG